MKRLVLVLLALTVFLPQVFAQNDPTMYSKSDWNMGGRVPYTVDVYAPSAISNVYFGIFVEDITDKVADKFDYDYSYGILVSKVVEASPAFRAGMKDGDIIMEINDQTIYNTATFDGLRANLQPGDYAEIDIWRQGNEVEIVMVMQARPDESTIPTIKTVEIEMTKGRKLSAGYGGGSWTPVWFMPEVDDVNVLLGGLGFAPISDKGMFMNGGAGKGAVGKGFFIGGFGASYEYEMEHANFLDPTYKDYLSYNASFGGVTLDKRFPLTRSLITSVGMMVGSGEHTVKYTSTNGDYTWPFVDGSDNFSATITRSYIAVQPRAELMFRLLDWLAIRAEVGYMYGYAPKKGWQVNTQNGNDFHLTNSPDTPFQGLTFSAGPWFGF